MTTTYYRSSMKKAFVTTDFIKKTVENLSHADDISIRLRDAEYTSLRFIYMRLCKDFKNNIKKYGLHSVARTIKRNHASVINGLKKFELDHLEDNNIYKEAYLIITEHLNIKPSEEYNVKAVSDYWRVKHILLQEKYRSVIRSLQKKRDSYNNINELAKKIAELEGDELKEAEIKMDAFFKIIEHRRKNA